ncbi:MAG TPA: 5'/3'-nucleotidase SurE [Acidimicrobiales bacterium]|nr:5'/3'-nucleotidase SurE [Acidimicrobiales bacterium]
MKVLVTNDDGVESPGLHALARALVGAGYEPLVVAPDRDMSGSGAAIGRVHLDEHIDAEQVELPGLPGVPAYGIDGPPGLCVLAARLGGFGEPPEVVVSGVNPGCNTGRAILHSGTVGAALTAANFGGRGLAVSIDVVSRRIQEQAGAASPAPARVRTEGPAHWDSAAEAAAMAVAWLVGAPKGTVLNINVPDRAAGDLLGARAATLAPFGSVRSSVVESAESGGRLQMELRPTTVDLPPGCDTALVAAGFVAVSAITGVRLDAGVDLCEVMDQVVPGDRRSA